MNDRHITARGKSCLSRRAALARVVALPLLLAGGCRAAPRAAGPPPRLTVWSQQHPVTAVQDLIAQQAATAAREVGAAAAVQSLHADDLRAKLVAAAVSGDVPDLAIVGDSDVAPLAARGLLLNVRDDLDRITGLNGDLFPPLRVVASSGPFVDPTPNQPTPAWAIPHASVGGAWLVRKDLLARQSVPLPRTFDDVRAAADKLTDPSAGVFGWETPLPIDDALDDLAHLALLAQGTSLFDPIGLKIQINLDAAAAGFQSVANLYRRDDGSPLAPTDAVDRSSSQVTADLVAGKVAQTIDFGGLYARILAERPSLQESVLALPPPTGPKGWFTSVPSTFLVVPRTGTAPDQTRALVARLLRPDRYDALVRAGRGSVIPPYAYLTKGPFWDEDPNYPVFFANARGDPARSFSFAPIGYPSPPTLPVAVVHASHVLAKALRRVVSGDTPAKAAAAALEQQAEKLVREALALQPTPTATPPPFWIGLLGPTPTPR